MPQATAYSNSPSQILADLKAQMLSHTLDMYIVPSTDEHLNEYVRPVQVV